LDEAAPSLAIDFDFNGHPEFAHQFAQHLAHILHDPGLLAPLDFHKCYRAYVRGKVESFHQMADGVPESERDGFRANGRSPGG
jgi:aminoglycoside phosphotransferase family enzyme